MKIMNKVPKIDIPTTDISIYLDPVVKKDQYSKAEVESLVLGLRVAFREILKQSRDAGRNEGAFEQRHKGKWNDFSVMEHSKMQCEQSDRERPLFTYLAKWIDPNG